MTRNVTDALGQKLLTDFQTWERLRRDKELEWAQYLRQAKGIYDPDILGKIKRRPNASEVYPKYTRSKEVPCVARLNSMLFPSNDRNWSISPTPKPSLSDMQIREIAQGLIRTDDTGAAIQPGIDEVQRAIKAYAEERCMRMQTEMDDQLSELNYQSVAKKVLKSGVRYGTGILKGPLSVTHEDVRLSRNNGSIAQETVLQRKPYVSSVPIWYWYPDMTSTEYDNGNGSFELHCMTKHQLRELAERADFFGDVIREYIGRYRDGDYKFRQWEIDVRSIRDETITQANTRNYQVLEYWGYVDGHDLAAAGAEIPEDRLDTEVWANVWLLGTEGKIIKATLNPAAGDAKIYHLFYWEKDETSIFGDGLCWAIRDSQITICAGARMLLDNAAISSGPQIEVNLDLLDEDESPDDLYPGRIWKRTGRGADSQYPAVRAYHIESRMADISLIIDRFKQFGDEESSIPSFLMSEPTSSETARGMSIRQSTTSVTIGDIVKNFDACNEGFLKALYQWNMEFNEKEHIKGDYAVKACGSSSLMTKELRSQALDFFATTLNDEERLHIKTREFLKERLAAHDLDPDKLMEEEEAVQQKRAALVDAEMQQLAKLKEAADIEYTKAKASHMRAKAGATDSESTLRSVEALQDQIRGEGEDRE